MTLFLNEADVAGRLTMDAVLGAVEGSFHNLANGYVRQEPRVRIDFPGGFFAAVCAVDEGLGLSAVKSYTAVDGELRGFVITLASIEDGITQAVIEGDLLTKLRTGAASGVAAAHLARCGASSIGIMGCGRQAPFQLDAVRRSLPTATSVIAWCRDRERLAQFCTETGARAATHAEDVTSCDVVIASTTSPTPVIHGAALRPGALVMAIGGDGHGDRELDDEAIQRTHLVTCDSIATSRADAADLWVPAEKGLINWDDVVELHDVVAQRHSGRASDDDIIFFKSSGLAAWDLAAAAELLRPSR